MDTLNATAASSEGRNSEDALKVLGRVADAFDNPSLHKTDKELNVFVVNVVKSRHLLTSFPSEKSLCQDATPGSYESSFDISYDEDVELGDVSIWEHEASYPYVCGRSPPEKQRKCSERVPYQDSGMYDVTKMLLTSSPLDRLDRLARMELKKTGWVERVDKWTIVEMGLPLPTTPSKTPLNKVGHHIRDSWERFSSTTTPPRACGSGCGHVTPERKAKTTTPILMRSSPAQLTDACIQATSTPIRTSRLSRTFRHPEIPRRGRLGQVVRNIVKRMLPPSSVGSQKETPPTAMTPRSDVSVESGWTFASTSSWVVEGCLDQTSFSRM